MCLWYGRNKVDLGFLCRTGDFLLFRYLKRLLITMNFGENHQKLWPNCHGHFLVICFLFSTVSSLLFRMRIYLMEFYYCS